MSGRFSFDPGVRKIVVHVGKVELGQHVHKAFQKIVADVLQIDPDAISIAPVSTATSPNDGLTAGSLSVQITGKALRSAAFELRGAMIEQASKMLGSNANLIQFDSATLEYFDQNRRVSIFEFPLAQSMKQISQFRDFETARPISKLVRGEVPFIQDLMFPDMLFARALRGRSVQTDLSDSVTVIRDGGFEALVALSQAALDRAWTCVSSNEMPRDKSCDGPIKNWITQRKFLSVETGETTQINGTIDVQATRPFLIHGSIGPSCGIARFSNGTLEVWTHSQNIFQLRDTIAALVGLNVKKVIVHHVPSAGCYGHNGADDAAMDAVLVCLQNEGHPVRVAWPRSDEFLHAPIGAPMQVQLKAELAEDGSIGSWRHTIWSAPHGQRPGSDGNTNLLAAIERDPTLMAQTIEDLSDAKGGGASRNAVPPYSIGSFGLTTNIAQDLPIRTSSIRALGAQMNVVAIEAAMNVLADRCAEEPLAFRLKHIIDPRGTTVLEKLRETLGSTPDPRDDEATGIAYSRYKGKAAYAAVGVRIRLDQAIQLLDVWAVVDAGRIVDMSGALNQVEGGIIQAASWTLCEGVLLRDGFIDASSLADYPTISWENIPRINAHFIETDASAPSLGVGECMVGPVSAAIVNAVSSMAGQTLTDLPLTRESMVRAFAAS